ncbi:MAG: SpoIIE family protein phosphatase [Anaerolineae bacterium]|nr:SpoIIE family protein phosphatase [Anaerolineae bacterium]
MSARSSPPAVNRPQVELPFDRNTAVGIGALAVAVLILIALIGLITLLPAQTISRTLSQQAGEQQRLLAGSVAHQMESYFNSVAYDLLGLANRPEIKSTARTQQEIARTLITDLAKLRTGQIKSIVRLDANGTPIYAWPDSYNQQIAAGQPLPWSVSNAFISNLNQKLAVQFAQQPLRDGGATYLLVTPVTEGNNVFEALAIELDLSHYFQTNLSTLQLSASGQLWVFDQFGNEIYHQRDRFAFRGDPNRIRGLNDTTILNGYPTSDYEAVVAPVFIAFAQSTGQRDSVMSIVISRAISEGQQEIFNTLQSLFLFGLVIIAFVVVIGVVVGRFLLRESSRRRLEVQRRTTARTLLEMSRALNSSLDLNEVLQRILRELGNILPHDSASIMLFNEEDRTVTIAAETGDDPSASGRVALPLNEVRGVREVLVTGKPVVINDCLTDPRWRAVPGSATRAWLGVPLRVREESVGVLNINSGTQNRFQSDDMDLAEAFADQAGVAIQNARAHQFQIQVYESELETARAIQTSLLPTEQPAVPELELAACAIPARHVSGDYHQYFPLPDGKLGIAVGDVSGKGIPAALLMAVITTALRDEIVRTPAPASLLTELNTSLLPRMEQNHMSSALVVAVFDPATRRVEIANGGMVQPYVRNGSGWEFVPVGGYPLGASARSAYSAKTLLLAPGSTLLVVSDGVLECQNLQQEFFGFERLEALLAELPPTLTAQQVIDAILDAVHRHLEGQEPQDDITIVAVRSLEL